MEGIQLLAAPSMNLNPGCAFNAQNQGTSGTEIRNPARAKMLAITLTACVFSLGTNRRRRAPTMGVKSTIERMWLYIRAVLSCQFPLADPTSFFQRRHHFAT